MAFEWTIFIIASVAGGIASVTGFGIGSLITPVLSLLVSTKLAVALVAIPHLTATAIRFGLLRTRVDKNVLLRFGVMSAIGGCLGAVLHSYLATPALTWIFGLILIFAGLMGATNLSSKLRFHGASAWLAGALSGGLGGLVGNQGGIRSAALLSFALTKESFVATATAIGLLVDAARLPVYFWSEGKDILLHWRWIAIPTVGVVLGTLLGSKVLKRLPEQAFRRTVSSMIFALGMFMLYQSA